MLNNTYLNKYNFLFITLDSLKYSSTLNAKTPNINAFADEHKANQPGEPTPFRKVYTQATYTLPSHLSMFYGLLPDNRLSMEHYYNRKINELSIRGDVLIEPEKFPGPTILIRSKGNISVKALKQAKELMIRYSPKMKN